MSHIVDTRAALQQVFTAVSENETVVNLSDGVSQATISYSALAQQSIPCTKGSCSYLPHTVHSLVSCRNLKQALKLACP